MDVEPAYALYASDGKVGVRANKTIVKRLKHLPKYSLNKVMYGRAVKGGGEGGRGLLGEGNYVIIASLTSWNCILVCMLYVE